jgi:hypothetical protein
MDLPREESLRWIVSRYAGLEARHRDGIGAPDLLQPTGEYFPDEFTPTPEGIARLVVRMLEYAPVRDGLDVRMRFLGGDEEDEGGGCGTGGCGSGACSTDGAKGDLGGGVALTATGYLLEIPVEAVRHPAALTATLARSVGGVVLAEAGEEVEPREMGGVSELAAIASGFGVIVLGGAHVYGKSCGGARVSRHTHLAIEEAAVALALFVARHGLKAKTARAHLETTQRAAFDEAHDWVTSNPTIVTQLRTRPEVLEAGMFRCEETKGFFGKLMARRAASEEERAFAFAPPRAGALSTAGARAKNSV